jgi:hypothetical protein
VVAIVVAIVLALPLLRFTSSAWALYRHLALEALAILLLCAVLLRFDIGLRLSIASSCRNGSRRHGPRRSARSS